MEHTASSQDDHSPDATSPPWALTFHWGCEDPPRGIVSGGHCHIPLNLSGSGKQEGWKATTRTLTSGMLELSHAQNTMEVRIKTLQHCSSISHTSPPAMWAEWQRSKDWDCVFPITTNTLIRHKDQGTSGLLSPYLLKPLLLFISIFPQSIFINHFLLPSEFL